MPRKRQRTQVTVRQHLLGSVLDFVNKAKMDWTDTAEALTELAVALPGYREEEASLFPLVVICDDLNATIGLAQKVPLGSGRRTASTATEALKKCAPLAQGGWCIFLERQGQGLRYGVFRPVTLSFSIDPQEIFDTADLETNHVCVVRSLSKDAVELLDDGGKALQLTLSARNPQKITVPSAVQLLVSHITSDVPNNLREPTGRFLTASLTRAIQDCHGTLVAVQDAGYSGHLCEGVWLEEPIDVPKEVTEVAGVIEKMGVSRLQGTDHLIRGMIRSDGITVFSSDAKLLGFGGFVQLPATAAISQGGARTRAFETLASHVGGALRAALKISQDGGVTFKYKRPK